jgi:plasmid stabilization system protein ParE
MDFAEDIRSVTDLKRHTREILDHVHATGRPVVLTVRHLIHGSYRTISRIAGSQVVILRVIRGARLLDTSLITP